MKEKGTYEIRRPDVAPGPRPVNYLTRTERGWQIRLCSDHEWEYSPTTLLVTEGEYCLNCGAARQEIALR